MTIRVGETHQTPADLKPAEDELIGQTGGIEIAWCGRGATAFYYACQTARAQASTTDGPEVILPSIACPSLVNTAHMAGLTPRFADVDSQTGMISLDAVKDRYTPQTIAVVFIHLYGGTKNLKPFAQWCRDHGVMLIEDNAEALGAGLPNGSAVGSVGDLAVYSFTRSKILGCGGGALLARTPRAAEMLRHVAERCSLQQPLDERARSDLANSYRSLQLSAHTTLRQNPGKRVDQLFIQARPAYDALYLLPYDPACDLATAWTELPAMLDRRRRKARIYQEQLAGGPWRLLSGWEKSGVCWRYSLALDNPKTTATLSEAVRRDGFHVSNLFWPLHTLFRPEDTCPAAEDFGSRIVNLWLDDTTDESTVNGCARSLRDHAKKLDA